MSNNIKVGTGLDCGCCGTWFETWLGYEDQDQDAGYGICQRCQGSIAEDNEKEWDKLISCLRSGLKPENQTEFDAMDRDTQKALAHKALDEGYITYSIERA